MGLTLDDRIDVQCDSDLEENTVEIRTADGTVIKSGELETILELVGTEGAETLFLSHDIYVAFVKHMGSKPVAEH